MKGKKASAAAASGAVALIFLILGFQIAIFSGNVFKFRQEARSGASGEIAVGEAGGAGSSVAGGAAMAGSEAGSGLAGGTGSGLAGGTGSGLAGGAGSGLAGGTGSGLAGGTGSGLAGGTGSGLAGGAGSSAAGGGEKSALRKALEASSSRERDYSDSRTVIADRLAKKKVETFEFDPNTVSLEELCRLGFSERQAQVILNYRDKGGRFRTPADFEKMYVVDSASFARLEPYIHIPKLDLNSADSEALLALRGIGPYYASKILSYRRRLGGSFTSLDQLLEIDGFDRGRLDGFRDDVELRRPPKGFDIWTATQAQLEAHPYIGSYAAKGIIRFKRTVDSLSWTLSALVDAGILSSDKAAKLR